MPISSSYTRQSLIASVLVKDQSGSSVDIVVIGAVGALLEGEDATGVPSGMVEDSSLE